MATPVLQFKRGAFSNLPALKAGEPGFTTDKYDFYIGLDNTLGNNKFFGSTRYWLKETTTTGSGLNLVEGTNNGTDYITIQSPGNLSGIVTYTLPGANGASGSFLREDGSGGLSWSSSFFSLTNTTLTGITTITGLLDVDAESDFSGITTFSNTTNNTLGDEDTGAVQVDGGVGIAKNLTVKENLHTGGFSEFVGVSTFSNATNNTLGNEDTGAVQFDGGVGIAKNLTVKENLHTGGFSEFVGVATFTNTTNNTLADENTGAVQFDGGVGIAKNLTVKENLHVGGFSEFVGVATFRGGTINLGDANTDDINVAGEFISNLVPNDDDTYNIGVNGKRWKNAHFAGIGTFATGAVVDALQLGINGAAEIDTSAGNLTLDSAGGTVTVDDNLNVTTGNTLSQADLTQFDVLVAGASGAINDSGGNLTFNSNTLTVTDTIDVTNVEVTNVKAKDGTAAITITNSSGDVGISSNLTVSGNLTILGSQTEVNTETLLVEDSLIEVGLVNSGGSLVAPSSDANIDVGLIFHYYSASAKKAAVYWDDSVSRIAVASEVSESSSVLTASTYAGFEIGSLWVNDCAGQSQVISCTGSERFLENITIDGGTF